MTFLSPIALCWLASIPVLVWLWRFTASRHRTVIASLVPFQHLMRKAAKRRTRVLPNLLFWLQLLILALAALALADPALPPRPMRTLLVLLDTSASMGAMDDGGTPFGRARALLDRRLAEKSADERVVIMTTAPVNPVTQAPEADGFVLRALADGLAPSDLGGNLSLAYRVGQMLSGAPIDRTLVLTDEPAPPQHEPGVEFDSVGRPLPNAAIVGLDAHEPLCAPIASSDADARGAKVIVWVQNFADQAQQVTVVLRHEGRIVAQQARPLDPGTRAALAFDVGESMNGLFEATLTAERDALAADNRATLMVRGDEPIRVAVALQNPQLRATVTQWLSACPRIAWQSIDASGPAQPMSEAVLVTDRPELATGESGDASQPSPAWPAPVIAFIPSQGRAQLRAAQWLMDAPHPIGEYLELLDPVPTSAAWSAQQDQWGDPVLWAISAGERIPLARVGDLQGRRTVSLWFDPSATPSSVPQILVFFNSLRWLTGSSGLTTTGQTLVVGPLDRGLVRVQRPHGAPELLTHDGGFLHYDRTTDAGSYVFTQGSHRIERVVNFLDPIESDTQHRRSTWAGETLSAPARALTPQPRSLASRLILVLLLVLIAEWIVYSFRRRAP